MTGKMRRKSRSFPFAPSESVSAGCSASPSLPRQGRGAQSFVEARASEPLIRDMVYYLIMPMIDARPRVDHWRNLKKQPGGLRQLRQK
jgi:hypothetical protein